MSLNFGEILQRAWQITWKFKVLWIFGILASCGQGGGGNGGNSNYQANGSDFGNLPSGMTDWFTPGIIAALIGFICLIWIVVLFLNTIGRIGLIRGTLKAERGAKSMGFGELFSESTPYFWRFFWLQLLIGLPILIMVFFLLITLIGGVVVANQGGLNEETSVLTMIPLLLCCGCIMMLIAIVLNFIGAQAQNAIVLEEKSVMESFRRGWEVIKGNLGNLIVIGLILFVINAVIGFVVAIPIFIIVLPAVAGMALSQGQDFTPLIFAALCICAYAPVTLVVNGILQAFSQSAWTLTYMRVTNYQSSAPEVSEPPQIVSDPLA